MRIFALIFVLLVPLAAFAGRTGLFPVIDCSSCSPIPSGSDGDIQVNDAGSMGSVPNVVSWTPLFTDDFGVPSIDAATQDHLVNTTANTWQLVETECQLETVTGTPPPLSIAVAIVQQNFGTAVVEFAITDTAASNSTFFDDTLAADGLVSPGEVVRFSWFWASFGGPTLSHAACVVTFKILP